MQESLKRKSFMFFEGNCLTSLLGDDVALALASIIITFISYSMQAGIVKKNGFASKRKYRVNHVISIQRSNVIQLKAFILYITEWNIELKKVFKFLTICRNFIKDKDDFINCKPNSIHLETLLFCKIKLSFNN
jgi:hypothetical protein